MLNTFIGIVVGIVGGNYLLECVLLPMWFGGYGSTGLAGERAILMASGVVITGVALRITKQWQQ